MAPTWFKMYGNGNFAASGKGRKINPTITQQKTQEAAFQKPGMEFLA